MQLPLAYLSCAYQLARNNDGNSNFQQTVIAGLHNDLYFMVHIAELVTINTI
jgi:hypothetical protein